LSEKKKKKKKKKRHRLIGAEERIWTFNRKWRYHPRHVRSWSKEKSMIRNLVIVNGRVIASRAGKGAALGKGAMVSSHLLRSLFTVAIVKFGGRRDSVHIDQLFKSFYRRVN
jgi:hypothetical protein